MQITPNRVAAITAALAALVSGVVVPVLGAVPEDWRGPTIMVALIVVGAVAVVYIRGGQLHEKHVADLEAQDVSIPLQDDPEDDDPEPVTATPDVPEGEGALA